MSLFHSGRVVTTLIRSLNSAPRSRSSPPKSSSAKDGDSASTWARLSTISRRPSRLLTTSSRRGGMKLRREPEDRNQSASLAEGLEETLALHELGVYELLGASFKTTNCLESTHALAISGIAGSPPPHSTSKPRLRRVTLFLRRRHQQLVLTAEHRTAPEPPPYALELAGDAAPYLRVVAGDPELAQPTRPADNTRMNQRVDHALLLPKSLKPTSSTASTSLLALALLLTSSVLLHWPTLRAGLFADDFLFLDQVRRTPSLWALLVSPDPLGNFFRPVSRQLYFWCISTIGAESPTTFHAVNLLLFLLIAICLFAIVRRLAPLENP